MDNSKSMTLAEAPTASDVKVRSEIPKANPLRGANYRELAASFVTRFPIGTRLSNVEFDAWAVSEGVFQVPSSLEKQSDEWLAHLQRRHQSRYSVNKAGTHPRMREIGSTPFVIESIGPDRYEVRTPHEAIQLSKTAKKVDSLVVTQRKQLMYLMQSADWEALPTAEQIIVQEMFYNIENFGRQVVLSSSMLSEQFGRLRITLRRAVEAGTIMPRNGGIRALVDGRPDDDEGDAPQ